MENTAHAMRILCMLPAPPRTSYTPEAEARRLAVMRAYSTASTQVDADYMPGAAASGAPLDEAARHALSAQRAAQAEGQGYDAFCPFGTLDFGVEQARSLVRIPVVGQRQACLLFCGLLDRRFAWTTYLPGSEERNFTWAREAGVGHLMVASTSIGFPNNEFPQRRGELLDRFVACAYAARDKGAEMMGVVAMSICPTE
jgi:Asp/Glu/hydantoin racemase